MNHLYAILIAGIVSSLALDEARRPPINEVIQGTWVSRTSPREVWSFEGNRWTFTREAHLEHIIMGGSKGTSVKTYPVPRAQSWGTFLLYPTKTPNVMHLRTMHPEGGVPHERTCEITNDTMKLGIGGGFGEWHYRTYTRDKPHQKPDR